VQPDRPQGPWHILPNGTHVLERLVCLATVLIPPVLPHDSFGTCYKVSPTAYSPSVTGSSRLTLFSSLQLDWMSEKNWTACQTTACKVSLQRQYALLSASALNFGLDGVLFRQHLWVPGGRRTSSMWFWGLATFL
jgi:hypothetical protein